MSATSYRRIPPIILSEFPQPVTALSFDPVSDTIWVGSSGGDVIGYHGTRGMRGVCYRVGGSLAVKKIVAGDNNVRAIGVSGEGLGSWTKGGMNTWFFRHSSNLTTFSSTPETNILATSNVDKELLYVDSRMGSVVRQTTTPSLITHMQSSHSMLLTGSSDGHLRVHDPRSGISETQNLIKAHTSDFQGLETAGNLAFTIGLGERRSRPFPDPFVKVYDLRTMQSLPPIPFSSGPAFINVIPKRSSSLAIVSNQGLINIVDITNPNTSEFYQLDLTSYVTSCSISATAAYMAFGDAEGTVHLLSQAEDVTLPFNGFDGRPVEWADTPAPLPEIDWSETTPLNAIGLPYYTSQLFSAWTPNLTTSMPMYPPPPKISSQLLNMVKIKDNIAYASLPKELKGRRNVVSVDPKKYMGRFRSDKMRKNTESDLRDFDHADSEISSVYRRVEIEYSKFGVEDFDFGFYNKTEYSGLETHILNSYTNPVLQVMHYCLPIRVIAKSHIVTSCPREHCLLCELGFVMRMLEDARGTNCQSSNFCKAVGVLAQASNSIELVDYGRNNVDVDYGHKIQIFHRFLIDHLSSEGNVFLHNPSLTRTSQYDKPTFSSAPVTQLLGVDGKTYITCSSCGAVREKDNMSHIIDLIYPRKGASNEHPPATDFVSILRYSLLRQITHKATCQSCKRFTLFTSRRSILSRDLPPVLAINACIYTEENMNLWFDIHGQTFLKSRIELRGQIGGQDDSLATEYSIRSLIVQILSKNNQSHLVAIIKVPAAEERADLQSPWFVFNDFAVQNISEEEALSFSSKWKIPAIVYYERVDLPEILDYGDLPKEIDENILSYDTSISLHRDPHLVKHEVLQPEELPHLGMLVAIDAEFVSMQQEEVEFRSDGTNKILRPAQLSLARVSVLRGDGPKRGIPFIDDYIHTSEVIVDYLTEFSGIRPGDLDPRVSPHTLTPLKVVYKKLRLLVDRGCIFIGHGLSKDFRITNIYVPPEQVIDTVDLYFLSARQRRLSLRFLTWFVLKEHIQKDTHDSIQDAESALKLFNAYQEYEEAGVFDQVLEELYTEGRLYNFKPPASHDIPDTSTSALSHTVTALAPRFPQASALKGGGVL